MPDSLLIFSIGPVQGFVAEARRAQDLWAGSIWLSEIAREALRACQAQGATPVYPADLGQASLPNRFVVRVPGDRAEQVARAAEEAAQAALRKPTFAARQALADLVPGDGTWEAIWKRQLDHHLEVHWVALPIGPGGYVAAYQAVSLAFEAAKRTRRFEQVQEDGFKDSLGGTRSALRTARMDGSTYWRAVAGKVSASVLSPDGHERLDALGATKRFGFEVQAFPSVSTVAAAAFLLRAGTEQPHLLSDHAEKVGRLGVFTVPPCDKRLPALQGVLWPYDGDLLYREALTVKRLKADYGVEPSEADCAAARASLRKLQEELKSAPSRYYAILTMDGDAMGEHVSACRSPEEHAELSRRLAAFARQATQIVNRRYAGRVVYAGGDDLLALLPLPDPELAAREAEGRLAEDAARPDAILAACDLAQAFAAQFADWPEEALPRRRGGRAVPFSISAGLAIVHHRYPLSAALAAAHHAEKAAKEVDGKAALAVHVLVRSGEPTEACAHWQGLREAYGQARNLFAQGALSPRLAHNLAEAAPAFCAPGPEEAFAAEVRRVAQRQRNRSKLSPEQAGEFARHLSGWAASTGLTPATLAAWLLVASFCVREGGAE